MEVLAGNIQNIYMLSQQKMQVFSYSFSLLTILVVRNYFLFPVFVIYSPPLLSTLSLSPCPSFSPFSSRPLLFFLCQSWHPFAIRYNDQSPLENMHCATGFELMNEEGQHLLSQLNQERKDEVRRGEEGEWMVGCVLCLLLTHCFTSFFHPCFHILCVLQGAAFRGRHGACHGQCDAHGTLVALQGACGGCGGGGG